MAKMEGAGMNKPELVWAGEGEGGGQATQSWGGSKNKIKAPSNFSKIS